MTKKLCERSKLCERCSAFNLATVAYEQVMDSVYDDAQMSYAVSVMYHKRLCDIDKEFPPCTCWKRLN